MRQTKLKPCKKTSWKKWEIIGSTQLQLALQQKKKRKSQLLSCILCFLGSLISYEQTGHGANYRPHLCWEL